MKRTIQQIFMLFIILAFYECTLQPLEPQQATEHFYTHVKQIVEEQLQYQINKEVKNSPDSFSMVVYNQKTYASTIGMRFETAYNAYAKKKGIFTIKGIHSQEITKYIFQYYQEELDMQMQMIHELILRQGELELDSNNNLIKNPFFLHLIQDVRMSIMENNKNHRIEFDIDLQQNEQQENVIVMDLKSRESTLARLTVGIKSEKINNEQNLDKTEFIMVVNVVNLADESEQDLTVEIPMISRNVNDFKTKMQLVHKYLNLDNYSNNNREHYLNLIDYLTTQFSGFVSRTTTDLEKQWELIKFDMKFKDKNAQGQLKYNPDDNSYELETNKNGKIMQKFQFKRMTNKELSLLFRKQKVHSLFQTINEIVLELFQDKHQELILPALPNWVLQQYEKKRGMITGMVLRNYVGFQHNNDFLFTVDNHTDPKKVEITYYGYNMSNLKFTHIYPAERFELETASLYIDYVIKAHLDLMRENNILNNSYMI